MPPRRRHEQVSLVYGEISQIISIPKDISIDKAKQIALENLSRHITTLPAFSKVEFDLDRTVIHPMPTPEKRKLGDLGGNVTMILVPRNPNKTSLGPVIHTLKNTDFEIKDVRSKLAAAELIAEESAPKPMTRKGGRTGHGEKKVTESVESLSQQFATLKLDLTGVTGQVKELQAKNEVLETEITELKAENTELKAGLNSVTHFAVMIAPIHIRVLLDQARMKIVKESKFNSWDELRDSFDGIYDFKHMISSTHQIPYDLSSFICEFTNVRRHGNQAAHTAKRCDIQLAVQQKPEGAERLFLEQLYQFVFNEDINFRDLV